MNNFSEIHKKATLQYLTSILLDDNTVSITRDTFTTREIQANDSLDEVLNSTLSQEDIRKIEPIINLYTSELIEIYFSMGLKTGARLMNQLLAPSDKDY